MKKTTLPIDTHHSLVSKAPNSSFNTAALNRKDTWQSRLAGAHFTEAAGSID